MYLHSLDVHPGISEANAALSRLDEIASLDNPGR
jgi:hypothetical protein